MKLHDIPTNIIIDRDLVYTSLFWKELFTIQEVDSLMSTTYYP